MSDPVSPPTDGSPFWSRHLRRKFHYILDLGLLAAAFALAYLLRFDFDIPPTYRRWALNQAPFVVLLQFLVLLFTGVYQFVWRYVGMAEVQTFLRGAFYSVVPLLVLRLGLSEEHADWRIPLSVILIDTFLAFGGLLGLRVLRRALYERYERRRDGAASTHADAVLLVGAGRAGVQAAREIVGRGGVDFEPIGFVDDDPNKLGTVIHGLKVLGSTDDLPQIAADLDVSQVIITIAATDAATMRRIVAICERSGLRVRVIPGLYDILTGKVSISRIRDIEIEDLLGRDPVRLDQEELQSLLTAKAVLVTGAGGSIGSELCRQVARFSPRALLLVERSEAALFETDRALRNLWPQLAIEPLVADIGDESRMRRILSDHRPEVILHAAAHKHVPMMEYQPGEAIKNNVLAVERLGRLAGEAAVEAFVLISTDKAVRPTSVMGASKRVAELICQNLDSQFEATHFVAVRFGNVMGSMGSVVPIFREQIERGGPVTVTHPEVKRYFMTIGEAAQLVLQAAAIGHGGEILILDMGEPMRVLDLARDMIALSGREDVQIVFTGLRPGEKLYEELELQGEQCDRTRHPKISVGRLQPAAPGELERLLTNLELLANSGDTGRIRLELSGFLEEADLERRSKPRAEPVELPTAASAPGDAGR